MRRILLCRPKLLVDRIYDCSRTIRTPLESGVQERVATNLCKGCSIARISSKRLRDDRTNIGSLDLIVERARRGVDLVRANIGEVPRRSLACDRPDLGRVRRGRRNGVEVTLRRGIDLAGRSPMKVERRPVPSTTR